MAQITVELDEATQSLVAQAALAQGISPSHWVLTLIREYAATHEWSKDCLALAGSFPDFPLQEEGSVPSQDVSRLSF